MPQILEIQTRGREAANITSRIAAEIRAAPYRNGVAHLFIQHTSASLAIQENADPDVMHDLLAWLDRMAPESGPYLHVAEGPDDMPAHLKSVLTGPALTIPFADGELQLGVWQGIYLLEHRRAPNRRQLVLTLIPEL